MGTFLRLFAIAAFIAPYLSFAQGKVFDIESAYEYARDRSEQIKIAKLRLDIMINNVKLVEFKYYPDIALSVAPLSWRSLEQENRSPESLDTLEPTGSVVLKEHLPTNSDITLKYSNSINTVGKRTESYSARFDQELLKLDAIDQQMTLAVQKRELQRIARMSVERNFLNSFRKAYYNYLEKKEILEIVRKKSREEEFLRDQSRRQYQAGIIAEYNLLDYMVDFNDTESERINAENAYVIARNDLFFTMNLAPDSEVEFLGVGIDDAASMVWNMDDMMRAALETNLDINTFRNSLLTSELNLKYLYDDYLPSVKLYASYENQEEENNYNTLVAKTRNITMGIQLTWNLFQDTFTTMYEVSNERNTGRISQLQLDESVRAVRNQIVNDMANLEKLYADYLVAYERESYTHRDFDLSNDRMKTGTISAWDMIRTKNRYFSAMKTSISRKYAFLRQVAQMLADYPVNDEISVRYASMSSRGYFLNKAREAAERNKEKAKSAREGLGMGAAAQGLNVGKSAKSRPSVFLKVADNNEE